ncbi:hypothetical protein SAMN05421678_105246 [Actinopolymorpha cephalotaxi]|uniref:Phosphoglycerol transferase MdoB-like AlkP superfamily enzyme n=1 Tax=Actinopolymorpha cephalotaxi TaxID=504797 RepID=A0A1I2R597_9ACTN|nr:hypothetical protein [Actinopolymorpha cephalotaxi]NYH82348.1 phosphoglycerol transferase MdoB-like AlkP superfamily enzyme [Actinopolymorpha cephalotaxi]SFG35905.1 hypothetical protein SAMN05421678_105246 [Actinopolymorpha cephalotaxi]
MTTATDSRPAPPGTRPRGSLLALRICALLTAIIVFAQPVLAGSYLTGEVGALGIHEANAHAVTALAFVQFAAAVVYAWRGRGRWWPATLTAALLVAAETQTVLGYAQNLLVHVPLGVGLVLTQILFTCWLLGPRARRARVRRENRR